MAVPTTHTLLEQLKTICLFFGLLFLMPFGAYAEGIANPCGGPYELLNLIDRPSNADSACVVPYKKLVIEIGSQYQQLTTQGQQYNFPEALFRFGLPANNELVLLLPNYIHQNVSGFSATTIGIKHQISYNEKWVSSAEILLTLPSGSAEFGNEKLGGALNGIFSYTINQTFNLTLMLGGSTQSQSSQEGGQYFTSVNPDVVLTYSPTDTMNFYGEIYGQSKTSPQNGSGFNVDGGVIYLLFPHVAIDLEVGQRVSGNLGGFRNYVGTGMSFELE